MMAELLYFPEQNTTPRSTSSSLAPDSPEIIPDNVTHIETVYEEVAITFISNYYDNLLENLGKMTKDTRISYFLGWIKANKREIEKYLSLQHSQPLHIFAARFFSALLKCEYNKKYSGKEAVYLVLGYVSNEIIRDLRRGDSRIIGIETAKTINSIQEHMQEWLEVLGINAVEG